VFAINYTVQQINTFQEVPGLRSGQALKSQINN